MPGKQRDARALGDQQVGEVVISDLLDSLADVAERRDRVSELDLALLAGRRGDDFLELRDRDREHEVGWSSVPPRVTVDRLLLRLEADAKHLKLRRCPPATLRNVNLPSSPVVADSGVPITRTRASASGCPPSCAVTRPVIVPCASRRPPTGQQQP